LVAAIVEVLVAGAGVVVAALLVEPLGAMLPGEMAGFGEFCGDCGAPVGAGAFMPLLAWVVLVPPMDAAGPPELLPVPVLPGEAAEPAGVSVGAFGAPVGAGEDDCAAAMPADMIIAAEASQMERMENLLFA
jgi:hypothetical protein